MSEPAASREFVFGLTAKIVRLEAEIERLEAEIERTRQAWVDGDDPECDDVCVTECKGPCGVGGQDR